VVCWLMCPWMRLVWLHCVYMSRSCPTRRVIAACSV
jgi:hypothetical protein